MQHKFNVENIYAHNGVEVISIRSTEYVYTMGAAIISDWRDHGLEYKEPCEKKHVFADLCKKIASMMK